MRWYDATTYRHWRLRKIKEMQRKQKALIMSGYQALRPGGLLLYCTCSFAPEENELIVEHLLKRTDAEIDSISVAEGIPAQAGLHRWRKKVLHADIAKTIRIVPDGIWDGFYLARVRKPHTNP